MIRTLLHFRNLDSTQDINDRLSQFIDPGFISGGQLVPVPAQLKIQLTPWKIIGLDGMVSLEDSDTITLNVPAGQTTVIAILAQYVANNNAIIQPQAIEISTFNALPNKAFYVIAGTITLTASATQVLNANINYTSRMEVDPLGRNAFRGVINSVGSLPASNNVLGDIYEVVDGLGGSPNLYAWDGTNWQIMTDVVSLAANLAAHEANLLTNQKHLSDLEYAAAGGSSGNGSSGQPLGPTNMFVDELDPRLPTLDEAQALAGSNGAPSSSNKYVTQDFPLAVPTEKAYGAPSNPYLLLTPVTDGNIYIGSSGVGTANQYFALYNIDASVHEEYQTTTFQSVTVTGIYSALPLIPSNEIDPGVVAVNGFYTGPSLYVGLSATPDSQLRLAYGQSKNLATYPIDAMLRRNADAAQTSAALQQTIQNISGRPFPTTPPVNEQNINLRTELTNLKEYNTAIFVSDNVVSNFRPASEVPEYNGDFVENIGIPPNYSFENTGLVNFTYVAPTVTYSAAVVLGSVIPGHVFIDGASVQYIVTAVGANTVNIIQRNGFVPAAITTTVVETSDGAIKPDNNPRQINLSDFSYLTFRDRIVVDDIQVDINEYHPNTGDVAYSIRTPVKSDIHMEPRLRMYGAWLNSGTVSPNFRVTVGPHGRMLVTGFFTDLYLLADLGIIASSLPVTVYVDNSVTPVGTVNLGGVNNAQFTTSEFHRQSFAIVNGLADGVPHTVELVFGTAGTNLTVYGVDLIRRNAASAFTIPGRAFVQGDLYKNDAIVSALPPVVPSQNRGLSYTTYVNRSKVLTAASNALANVDGPPGSPAGVAVSGNFTLGVTSGVANFTLYYNAGDIVRLQGATSEQILLIQSIAGATITFTTAMNLNGSVVIFHLGSTTAEEFDTYNEYVRYTPSQFGVGGLNDFAPPFSASPATRSWTLEDGMTSMAGVNLLTTMTGIDGYDSALLLNDAAATLRIRAIAAKIDILVANDSAIPMNWSVDGSPNISATIPAFGLKKVTLVTNTRYQTHDILISNSAGLTIAALLLYEPAAPAIQGTPLGTTNVLANYVKSQTTDGTIIPIGAVAVDAFTSQAQYVIGPGTGTNWTEVIDPVNAPLAKYVTTDREGSYVQFDFYGEGFECEYVAGPDRGQNIILVNGLVANSSNFVAQFIGINAGTGIVDMYNVAPVRQRFGMVSLPYGRYTVQVQVQQPRVRNPGSTGFGLNISTIYLLNADGATAMTPAFDITGQTLLTASVRDTRRFDPGNIIIQTVPQIRNIETERDDYVSIGFNAFDDFICTVGGDCAPQFNAAIAVVNASAYARKLVVKPGTYKLNSVVALPGNIEVEGWGTPIVNDGGATIAFQIGGSGATIHNISFGAFATACVDVNSQTGCLVTDCRNVTVRNIVYNDTFITPVAAIPAAVVGTAAQVKAGQADFTSLQSAINAVAAGGKIIMLSATIAENITLNKNLTIFGQGWTSQIAGNWTFGAASNFSLVRDLGVSGTITFLALSQGNKFDGYQNAASVVADHGIDNITWLIDQ